MPVFYLPKQLFPGLRDGSDPEQPALPLRVNSLSVQPSTQGFEKLLILLPLQKPQGSQLQISAIDSQNQTMFLNALDQFLVDRDDVVAVTGGGH